ncbi:predicted protein [Histoplasma capsulatum var. duboisii H88]|uniref:Predicted protein n=1 Tax=Ajellomyces capsulatus (strain H88) TaxID=544711 RepID=F0U6G9_AJEC8|nr:predicted protein [Histoplasma capsulatum var. duboisii H88]
MKKQFCLARDWRIYVGVDRGSCWRMDFARSQHFAHPGPVRPPLGSVASALVFRKWRLERLDMKLRLAPAFRAAAFSRKLWRAKFCPIDAPPDASTARSTAHLDGPPKPDVIPLSTSKKKKKKKKKTDRFSEERLFGF